MTKSAVNRIVASERLRRHAGSRPAIRCWSATRSSRGTSTATSRASRRTPIAGSVRRRGVLSNRGDKSGQSPLGSIIADADLEATRAAGARIALLNPGSVRAPIDGGREGA